jgi:hypothetical protein
MTALPTDPEASSDEARPRAPVGGGYIVLFVLLLAAICLFLALAIPIFTGIVGLMLQDLSRAGGA